MKAWVQFEIDDTDRRAIAHHYGRTSPATRADFRAFVEGLVSTTMDDIRYEYEHKRSRPEDDDE